MITLKKIKESFQVFTSKTTENELIKIKYLLKLSAEKKTDRVNWGDPRMKINFYI